jgi:hypothetical protein
MNEDKYTEEERDNRKPIKSPVKAIRPHCLECVCGAREAVKHCTDPGCWLYPYRFGKNPFHAREGDRSRAKVGLGL